MLLGEKVVISSPLSAGVARDRLRAARAAFGEDGYRIAGRISERRITVSIRQASIRSSWIPILRGRLEDAPGGGSRLVATVGWHPVVKVFSAVWLGALVFVFSPLFVLNAVFQTVTGDVRAAAGAIAMCLAPVALLLMFLGLTRLGQPPAGYLRAWLERQLGPTHTE
jgi:hypothetical protein